MKKFVNIFLSIVMAFVFMVPKVVHGNDVLSFGQIAVTMPEITAEVKGSGYDKSDITANLDSEKLSVVDATMYDSAVNSTCAYILVDLSTSMRGSFELVKKNILAYIENMGGSDKIILITFGESKVKTVLTGNEDRAEAIDVVKQLKCNENGTLFYEALSQAYQLSNSSTNRCDREYVIAFSDGIDVQKGATTFDEVLTMYSSHALPLYAACSYNASKEAADRFGQMARTSGGSISIIKSENEFSEFLKNINEVTLIHLRASSNYADGKEKQLSIKIGSLQVEYNVPVVRSIADTVAPTVEKLYYNIEKDSFIIVFSEKVKGALSTSSYKVIDPAGNQVEVSNVFYSESEDTYEIKLKDSIRKGTYTIEFSGITDDSKESNPIVEKKTITVEKTKNRFEMPIWAIVAIVVGGILIIAAVVFAIIFSSKKREVQDNEDPADILKRDSTEIVDHIYAAPDTIKHHIKTDEAVRIRLKIKTGKTSEQNVETTIVSSLIVGRSDICDIYIDDTKLSRQHFVIENDNGKFYIMDLQSRNGTMLNGIRINSRQPLNNGDKILAGLSDIIITVIGR